MFSSTHPCTSFGAWCARCDKLCLEHEVDERRAIDLVDFAEGPIVTHEAPLYRPRTRRFSLPDAFLPHMLDEAVPSPRYSNQYGS